jgi:hypothetical protein
MYRIFDLRILYKIIMFTLTELAGLAALVYGGNLAMYRYYFKVPRKAVSLFVFS